MTSANAIEGKFRYVDSKAAFSKHSLQLLLAQRYLPSVHNRHIAVLHQASVSISALNPSIQSSPHAGNLTQLQRVHVLNAIESHGVPYHQNEVVLLGGGYVDCLEPVLYALGVITTLPQHGLQKLSIRPMICRKCSKPLCSHRIYCIKLTKKKKSLQANETFNNQNPDRMALRVIRQGMRCPSARISTVGFVVWQETAAL